MNIVKDGHPFIFAFAIITFAVGYWGSLIWAVVPAVLMLFFIYFFRNPNRPTQSDDSIIYSPADGTVMAIEDFYDEEYLNEDAIMVTIFLYKKSASFENERHAIGVQNDKMRVLVIQVAGLLARRIVSWVTLGHNLKQGECYGMIKFGSSTELVLPKNVEILVKKGDSVVGGVSLIGRVH